MAQVRYGRITPQAVGAYGEKAVEAELLRRGSIPSNVNATVKNAADFDIFALKGQCTVQLRVKTCSPGQNAHFSLGFGRERTSRLKVSIVPISRFWFKWVGIGRTIPSM